MHYNIKLLYVLHKTGQKGVPNSETASLSNVKSNGVILLPPFHFCSGH